MEGLPRKSASRRIDATIGTFQAERGFSRHCRKTSVICVRSTTPRRSTRPSAATSASVPITGPAVITGEAIRTRVRARPIAAAMRCERSSPWPGVNQARAGCPPS